MVAKKVLCALGLVVLASGVSGCSNLSSIFRTPNSTTTGVGVVTDAEQRIVLRKPKPSDAVDRAIANALIQDFQGTANSLNNSLALGKILDRQNIVCAEPSPDVAQALTTALTMSVQASKATGAANTANTGANIGLSMAESIIQLGERLAVIQLLRDKMYRACEAYANGAIPRASYTLILARMDKTMTTLLSAEMAAGAFGRPLAGVSGNAMTASVSAQELLDAQTRVDKAEAAEKVSSTTDTQKAVTDAKKAQAALLAKGMATSASGTVVANAGKLSNASAVGGIAAIHRAYMNDSGLEPFIDACLTAMTQDELTPAMRVEFGTAKNKVNDMRAVMDTRIEAQKRARENLERKKSAVRDHEQNVKEWKAIAQLAEEELKLQVHDEAAIALQMAEGELHKATKKFEGAQGEVVKAEVLVASTQAGYNDATQNFDAALNELRNYQSPFMTLCDDMLLEKNKDGGIVKKLIDAKTTYQRNELQMAKVDAIRESLTACNASVTMIDDATKKANAAQACALASKEAMIAITAIE